MKSVVVNSKTNKMIMDVNCFMCAWKLPSLVSAMVDWLSEYKGIGCKSGWKTFLMRWRSQMPSLAAWVAAMYSASVVDKVMSSCFFNAQVMAPPSRMYAMACWCSWLAPSASVKPSSPHFPAPKVSASFFVPINTCRSVSQPPSVLNLGLC